MLGSAYGVYIALGIIAAALAVGAGVIKVGRSAWKANKSVVLFFTDTLPKLARLAAQEETTNAIQQQQLDELKRISATLRQQLDETRDRLDRLEAKTDILQANLTDHADEDADFQGFIIQGLGDLGSRVDAPVGTTP